MLPRWNLITRRMKQLAKAPQPQVIINCPRKGDQWQRRYRYTQEEFDCPKDGIATASWWWMYKELRLQLVRSELEISFVQKVVIFRACMLKYDRVLKRLWRLTSWSNWKAWCSLCSSLLFMSWSSYLPCMYHRRKTRQICKDHALKSLCKVSNITGHSGRSSLRWRCSCWILLLRHCMGLTSDDDPDLWGPQWLP